MIDDYERWLGRRKYERLVFVQACFVFPILEEKRMMLSFIKFERLLRQRLPTGYEESNWIQAKWHSFTSQQINYVERSSFPDL
jgi:hypothetical protein